MLSSHNKRMHSFSKKIANIKDFVLKLHQNYKIHTFDCPILSNIFLKLRTKRKIVHFTIVLFL